MSPEVECEDFLEVWQCGRCFGPCLDVSVVDNVSFDGSWFVGSSDNDLVGSFGFVLVVVVDLVPSDVLVCHDFAESGFWHDVSGSGCCVAVAVVLYADEHIGSLCVHRVAAYDLVFASQHGVVFV